MFVSGVTSHFLMCLIIIQWVGGWIIAHRDGFVGALEFCVSGGRRALLLQGCTEGTSHRDILTGLIVEENSASSS